MRLKQLNVFQKLQLKTRLRWGIVFLSVLLLSVGLAQLLAMPSADVPLGADTIAPGTTFNNNNPILPIPISVELDLAKVDLGRRLFKDNNLSNGHGMACETCHQLDRFGVDGKARSLNRAGQPLDLNTPTVFNSGFNFRQNWDGSAATLEEQVDRVLLSPREMGTTWSQVLNYLQQNRSYAALFQEIYQSSPSQDTVKDAIATFERSLMTPNAPFDQYLNGNESALSTAEKAGYDRFQSYGCAACHQGVNVGGNLYQRLGVVEDYFITRDTINPSDLGRLNITNRPRDRYVFKVPSLRNIEYTAPYLHDGSIETLEAMVKLMGTYQLGRDIPDEDVELIIAFLKTLSGELPEQAWSNQP